MLAEVMKTKMRASTKERRPLRSKRICVVWTRLVRHSPFCQGWVFSRCRQSVSPRAPQQHIEWCRKTRELSSTDPHTCRRNLTTEWWELCLKCWDQRSLEAPDGSGRGEAADTMREQREESGAGTQRDEGKIRDLWKRW